MLDYENEMFLSALQVNRGQDGAIRGLNCTINLA